MQEEQVCAKMKSEDEQNSNTSGIRQQVLDEMIGLAKKMV